MTPEQIEEALSWFPDNIKELLREILSRIDTLESK